MRRPHHDLTPPCIGYRHRAWITGMVLSMLIPALSAASSAFQGEFIPFPQVVLHSHNQDAGATQQHGSSALVDFFYTAKYHDWRLLGEAVVSDDERELERFMVGRVTPGGTQAWLGRYHTALGQWNHKFHHGGYLQTSIHRPGIIEFEDDGGVIPAHATGITLAGDQEFNERIVGYTLEFGLGPGLGNQGQLVPFNLLDFSDGEHDLSVTAKLTSYSADDPFDDSGIFAGHIIIPSHAVNIREVKQTQLGAYTNYSIGPTLWRASGFYVVNALRLAGGADKDESFAYAYIQPEYTYNTIWTYYGRWEKSFGAKNDLYIQQVPSFIIERAMLGARYQMNGSQALKFELARLEQYSQHFNSVELQWSAALP